jgi:hypothetical protein
MNEYAARTGWRVSSTYELGDGFAIRIYTGMSRNTNVLLEKEGK